MPDRTENEVSIVGVDRVQEGVLLHFSEGTSVLYHAQFLYDVKIMITMWPLSWRPKKIQSRMFSPAGASW